MSRAELADAVNAWLVAHTDRHAVVDEHYVARLERGKIRWPNADYRSAFAAVFNSPESELGFQPSSANRRPVRTPAAQLKGEPVTRDVCEWALHDALGTPVGSDFVNSLRETVDRIVALNNTVGGPEIARLTVAEFRAAQGTLASGRYRTSVERDLEAATAELGELAGWLLYDAELQDEARQVNLDALALARTSGDLPMEWFLLTNLAMCAVHTGRPYEALRITSHMQERDNLPGRVAALVSLRRARALAALGDDAEQRAEFGRARSLLDNSVTSRDPAWTWWMLPTEMTWHEGMAHAALGDWSRSLPELADAVESYTHDRRGQNGCRALLLEGAVRAGAWAEAEHVAHEVVLHLNQTTSGRARHSLRRTAALMDRSGARQGLRDTLRAAGV
ncbi:hypothetical protein SAMN05216266_11541 [Amycolatopsis marina]|uniref:XRE family transcriptional regulator n=1 Tax=Amycolatopsis marina TaxID=490629 RepID=A0A1I1BLB9_9PSEU|nr:hypothetical protein [Amycolatopsis marina]SFB51194.1 hypothetical protein SAMN05216266_11541 [Amycolatopsis marina]